MVAKLKMLGKEEEVEAMVLPTEPSPPSANISNYKFLIYGKQKIGKTSFAAQFPAAIFAKTEDGTKGLLTFEVDINNWDDFMSMVKGLEENEHNFKTLVVDVFERLHTMACVKVAKEAGVADVGDIGWGKGWADSNLKIEKALERIVDLGMGIVLLCHDREMEVVDGGVQVIKTIPNLSGSPRGAFCGWVDCTLCLDIKEVKNEKEERRENVRVAYCQPTVKHEAGGRVKYMPEYVVISPDAKTGFTVFKDEFNKALRAELEELGLLELYKEE